MACWGLPPCNISPLSSTPHTPVCMVGWVHDFLWCVPCNFSADYSHLLDIPNLMIKCQTVYCECRWLRKPWDALALGWDKLFSLRRSFFLSLANLKAPSCNNWNKDGNLQSVATLLSTLISINMVHKVRGVSCSDTEDDLHTLDSLLAFYALPLLNFDLWPQQGISVHKTGSHWLSFFYFWLWRGGKSRLISSTWL